MSKKRRDPMLTIPASRDGAVDVQVNESEWRALLARAHDLDSGYVKVGVLQGQGAEQLVEGEAEGSTITLAELAAIHEYGSPTIPSRSFIAGTFMIRRANELASTCARLCREVVTKGMPAQRALQLLGQWAAKEVKSTFTEIDIPPPLAPATIRAKGSSRPLIDTGQLRNSITYAVVEEESLLLEGVE